MFDNRKRWVYIAICLLFVVCYLPLLLLSVIRYIATLCNRQNKYRYQDSKTDYNPSFDFHGYAHPTKKIPS